MRRTTRLVGFLAAMATVAALAGACRGGGGGDDDGDDDGMMPDGGGGAATIYDVQQGMVAEGTVVTLKDVVVTAIDGYGARFGSIYVQEQGGGAYSGVLVFGATLPSGLAVGDIVTVSGGAVEEFICDASLCPPNGFDPGYSITEISPLDGGEITVTKTGTGAPPAPTVVDPVALAADDAEAEKWEGVLIKFENVAVVRAPRPVSSSDPLLRELEVTGPFAVSSSLAKLSAVGNAEADPELALGDCLASVTGIGDYFFTYKLLPRSAADFETGGTGCAVENDMALCTDMMDNDHDGFTDCSDRDCQDVMGLDCSQDTTVSVLQMGGMVTPGTPVTLSGVVVTAVAKFRNAGSTTEEHRVWVADSATAAPYNGILVFKAEVSGMGATIDTLAPGDIVDVSGEYTEFNGLSEIQGVDAMTPPTVVKTGMGAAPTPLVVAVADLATPATAEQYEGVLVTVQNVLVTSVNPDDPMNFGEWAVGVPGTQVRIDDVMVARPSPLAVGDCFTIIGPFDFTFANYKIDARNVSPGTCN